MRIILNGFKAFYERLCYCCCCCVVETKTKVNLNGPPNETFAFFDDKIENGLNSILM